MKTIEEKAKEYAFNMYDKTQKTVEQIEKCYKNAFKEAQRWISVEDELPEEGVSVLIKNDFGYFGINVLENGIWRMCTVEKIAGLLNLKEYELENFATPTHWRPIEY